MPGLKVLVVEKTDRFDWKVGESTVEKISAYFLTRVLKQYDHLSREQLPKQAFRYWFVNEKVTCLRDGVGSGADATCAHAFLPARPVEAGRAPVEGRGRGGDRGLAPGARHGLRIERRGGQPRHRRAGERRPRRSLGEVGRGRERPPRDAGPQTWRSDADRVPSDLRDLGEIHGRQGHGRPGGGRNGPGGPVRARRARVAAPGDQPLYRVGLLDLVHPAEKRRDLRRPRLGQAARDPSGRDASGEAAAISGRQPSLPRAARARPRPSKGIAAPTVISPTSWTGSSGPAGPASETPADSWTPSTHRDWTRWPSPSTRAWIS